MKSALLIIIYLFFGFSQVTHAAFLYYYTGNNYNYFGEWIMNPNPNSLYNGDPGFFNGNMNFSLSFIVERQLEKNTNYGGPSSFNFLGDNMLGWHTSNGANELSSISPNNPMFYGELNTNSDGLFDSFFIATLSDMDGMHPTLNQFINSRVEMLTPIHQSAYAGDFILSTSASVMRAATSDRVGTWKVTEITSLPDWAKSNALPVSEPGITYLLFGGLFGLFGMSRGKKGCLLTMVRKLRISGN